MATGWEGILDQGERILWQGRPDAELFVNPTRLPVAAFGLAFAGFALFWMMMAAQAGGGFWMFGLIHFSVGLGMIAVPLLGPTYRRRHTWYTLTDRRAFIATDLPVLGRKLKSYPITPDTVLEFLPGDEATIRFARETRRGSKGRTYTVDIGFERIDGGEKVLALMRELQKGAP